MKKYLFSAVAAFILISTAAVAQQNEKNPDSKPGKENKRDKKKMKEYEEVIIKRKNSEKDTKVTIEIKDDEVFVDGKPIDDFVDDEISVQRRDINKYNLINPKSPFRFEDGGWSVDELDTEGDINRPFLGITSEGSSEGVRITSVADNSGAANAGLKKGDVITKLNDKAVFDHEQVTEIISLLKPDDKVNIIYKRDGKENKTTATLGKRKFERTRTLRRPGGDVPPMIFNFDNDEFGDVFQYHNARPKLGLKVQDTEDGKGVKVLGVDEGSAAEKAGIKENDIITSFEGKEISSAGELAKASREANDKSSMKVQLNRNGKPQTIEVKVPKKLRTANL